MSLSLVVPSSEDERQRLMAWTAALIPGAGVEGAAGFGVARDGKLIASIFYSNWYPPHRCDIGVASVEASFLSRRILHAVFWPPFRVWNVRRLGALTHEDNARSRRLLTKLGFTFEGIIREGWSAGGNAASYSMLPAECRWIRD